MKVVLIDADSLLYIVCYKFKESNNLEDYIIALDDWIHNIITTCEGTYYLGFITIGQVFRHKIAKSKAYKSGRPKDKPKFYYELRNHLRDVWKFISFDELEAEDLLAINVEHCKQHKIDYVIAGIDHDLEQLDGQHFNYRTNSFKTITKAEAEYNFAIQLIQGCSTDKIVGIEGYGEVKAKALLSNNILAHRGVYYTIILEEYIKVYGLHEGINKFTETFNLCYLLRSEHEVYKVLNSEFLTEVVVYATVEYKPKENLF